MSSLVHLVVVRPDGRRADDRVSGDLVTSAMLDAAEDPRRALVGEESPPGGNFYDPRARAFGPPRAEAKRGLCAAAYGKRERTAPG